MSPNACRRACVACLVAAATTTPTTPVAAQDDTDAAVSAPDPRRAQTRRDRILGLLVGSAIGDALGAPTEMWPREKVEAHFAFVVEMRDVIREPSPEGVWGLNGPAGTTTDDTRWKKLVVEYFTGTDEEPRDAVRRGDARAFAEFIIETQRGHFERIRAIDDDDVEQFVDGTQRLLWLDEWVKVADAYLKDDVVSYTAALNRFYGGEMACAGLLFCPVVAAVHPGAPGEAYEATFELDLFDIGYARDISSVTAAMISAALAPDASRESVLQVLWKVDPREYFKSRLVGRTAYRLYEDALVIAHEARTAKPEEKPAVPLTAKEQHILELTRAYELLDKVARQHSFHAAEIHLVNLTAILFSDWDFARAMQFVVSYGRDNDTTAAVTGALLGAFHGVHGLPEAWVKTVLERNRAMGIDLEAMADRLAAAVDDGT